MFICFFFLHHTTHHLHTFRLDQMPQFLNDFTSFFFIYINFKLLYKNKNVNNYIILPIRYEPQNV